MDPIWYIAGAAVFLLLKNLVSKDVQIQIQIQIPSLPEDIIFNILSRLPPQKLIELRCVSKSWLNLIESASFIETHLRRSKPGLLRNMWIPIETNPLKVLFHTKPEPKPSPSIITNIAKKTRYNNNNIVVRNFSTPNNYAVLSTCRGLLLFGGVKFGAVKFGGGSELFIANPLTKWWLRLPWTSHRTTLLCNSSLFGLTYIASSRKYKVVHYFVCKGTSTDKLVGCEILTVGESNWRLVHTSHTRLLLDFIRLKMIFIKDVAYWIVAEIIRGANNPVGRSNDQFIVSLDMIEEKFHKSKHNPSRSKDIGFLMEIRGGLAFLSNSVDHKFDPNGAKFEIWVWNEFMWVKEETIDLQGLNTVLSPYGILENGKVIIFRCTRGPHCYHLYDVQLKQKTCCLKFNGDDIDSRFFPHMDTLCECKI